MTIAAVIPVRNRPIVLERAIRSIQAQHHPVDEIIVVDDASTDNTVAVTQALAAVDPRIRVVIQPQRGGASAARNRGFRESRADWIAFLDSDDEWLPEKLARQFEGLAVHPDRIASFTGHHGIHADHVDVYHMPPSVDLRTLQGINQLSTTSSALIRRDALEAVNGFDESLPSCQDWDLWIRLRARGDFLLIPDPLVRFHQAGGDRISRDPSAVIEGHRVVFERILSAVPRGIDRRRVRALHRLRTAQILLWDFDRPWPSLQQAAISMALWPNRGGVGLARGSVRRLFGRS